MIKLNKIFYYNKNIKMNISCSIKKGETISIFGPNGAGKTTLLNIIAGFLFVKKGQIIINSQNHTKTMPSNRPFSMIFQKNNLFDHLNIMLNIGLGLNSNFSFNKEEKQKIKDIAKKLSIHNYLYQLPKNLSDGQIQRVAIARCLLSNKPILLLDEPFSSLDLFSKLQVMNLLKKYCYKKNITLIIILHNIEDSINITKRSLIINNGTLIWDGKTKKLFKNKKNFLFLNKYLI